MAVVLQRIDYLLMRLKRVASLITLLASSIGAAYCNRIATPKEQFGFNLGDDYQLANYKQLTEYWYRLAKQSARVKIVEIGKTEEGRTMIMAIVTSPRNHGRLLHYKKIARRLALAEGLTDDVAHKLASEGKSVVWIDGGLHASEVLGAQQLMETVYHLASGNDEETRRILEDVIVLAVPANPDGLDLVADWYMREKDPKKRSTAGLPRLYQKYIGHDNNRDFYASTQSETKAMNRVMYREWFPQIVYNHHQTGPAGTVLFMPPFRDPFNYNLDPLIPAGIDLIGAAMQNRFLAEGKTGATTRSGSPYSTWWNGGLRTTCYFHNMIGLLTETIGSPTPTRIPFLPQRQLPKGDLIAPVPPQEWHFRQSIDYSVSANKAVLDLASKHRSQFLYNIYLMGRNSIERGSRDTWTATPKRIAAISGSGNSSTRTRTTTSTSVQPINPLHRPEWRDPQGFIIPSDQPDFPTATKFVNALIETGIAVYLATQSFSIEGHDNPAGSYVVKCAQAFRPHILDMFEPQDHPDDFAYPGGPPVPPYDTTGYTLAFQMGVKFDRIMGPIAGPFEKIEGLAKPPRGELPLTRGSSVGFMFAHEINDSFAIINRLLKAGEVVNWLDQPSKGVLSAHPAGTFYTTARSTVLEPFAKELGVSFDPVSYAPDVPSFRLQTPRIALWDRYGGSMTSGWTRWILERFEFPFKIVYPAELDAGGLRDKFDILILPDGAIAGTGGSGGGGRPVGDSPPAAGGDTAPTTPAAGQAQNIPDDYRNRRGSITRATTVPRLREFLESGGSIMAIGSSTRISEYLGLAIQDALVEKQPDGTERRLPREKFYVPGSVLRAQVDNTMLTAAGMGETVDLMFDKSPAFRLGPDAADTGVRRIAWFEGSEPLRSGWAWGQKYLADACAAVEAKVGKGRLYLFGPEILFRAQPHGTFKFLFNAILLSSASRSESVK